MRNTQYEDNSILEFVRVDDDAMAESLKKPKKKQQAKTPKEPRFDPSLVVKVIGRQQKSSKVAKVLRLTSKAKAWLQDLISPKKAAGKRLPYVVSIAGASRIGKSTLMNFIFESKHAKFETSEDPHQPCTAGIDALRHVLQYKSDSYILLDCQGCNN